MKILVNLLNSKIILNYVGKETTYDYNYEGIDLTIKDLLKTLSNSAIFAFISEVSIDTEINNEIYESNSQEAKKLIAILEQFKAKPKLK